MIDWKLYFIIVLTCICFPACGLNQLFNPVFAISVKGHILPFYMLSLESYNTLSTRPTSHIQLKSLFFPTKVYLHTVKSTLFSVQFCKLHIQSCNRHHNQDIEQFHHPRKFPCAPLQSVLLPQPQPLATNNLFCLFLVLAFQNVIQMESFR